jgi:hypothetical protein
VKRDTCIEQYYAPPRGLNHLRTHAKLMWVSAVSLWVVGPVIVTPVISGLSPHALRSPRMEGGMSLVWAMAILMTFRALITTWIAYRPLRIAVTHGLPEPGIREWSSFTRRIDELRRSR